MKERGKRHNVLISGTAAVVGSAVFYLFFKKARKKHRAGKMEAGITGKTDENAAPDTGEAGTEAFVSEKDEEE